MLRKAIALSAVTMLIALLVPAATAVAGPPSTELQVQSGPRYHAGHKTWTFHYSPDPGVEFNVSAEIFVNIHDVTPDIEGVVLWSGDYRAVDGFLQLQRNGVEVSSSEEVIAAPASQMDGEWYQLKPPLPHNYVAELSGVGITFPNGDVVQWDPITSNSVTVPG